MIGKKWVDKFSKNPKQLFLIDGFGAMLSAFLLGIVLVRLESVFGIPAPVLYVLASIPIFFSLYDFYCYFGKIGRYKYSLYGIGLMNLIYCLLSLGLAFSHFEELTYFGWIYIVGEVLIVSLLAFLEISVAKKQGEIEA